MGKETKSEKCEEKMDLNDPRAVPDGSWGWIISLAAFTVQFIILGLQNHLGLIHREHLEHFGQTKLRTGTYTFDKNIHSCGCVCMAVELVECKHSL